MRTDKQVAYTAAAVSISLTVIMFMQGGCAKKPNAQGTTSQASPYEQVMAWNAAMAQANHSVEQGVIIVQQSNLLSVEETNRVLTVQAKVAILDKQATLILEKGPTSAKLQSTQLRDLLSQIRDSAATLVADPALGTTNSARTMNLKASIDALYYLADLIFNTLHTEGIISYGKRNNDNNAGEQSSATTSASRNRLGREYQAGLIAWQQRPNRQHYHTRWDRDSRGRRYTS